MVRAARASESWACFAVAAACWAAFAHAVSGQRLVPRYGRIGFLARELLDEIPYTVATV